MISNRKGISHKQLVEKTGLSRSYLYQMLRKGSKHYDPKLASAKYWASGRPGLGPVRYSAEIVDQWMADNLELSQAYLDSDDDLAMNIAPPLPALVTNIAPMVDRATSPLFE